MGLSHTWNQDTNTRATTDQLCAAQTGPDYASFENIPKGLTDAVRDTAPQLPVLTTDAGGRKVNSPIFFTCNSDGTFDPQKADMEPQAVACDGAGLTGGRYFNNFYNIMSYFGDSVNGTNCDTRLHRHTFTAGQNARSQCVWRCYRLNQCGTGSFPF